MSCDPPDLESVTITGTVEAGDYIVFKGFDPGVPVPDGSTISFQDLVDAGARLEGAERLIDPVTAAMLNILHSKRNARGISDRNFRRIRAKLEKKNGR